MRLNLSLISVLAFLSLAGFALSLSTFFMLGDRANPALDDAGLPTKRVVGALIFAGSLLMIASAIKWKRATTAWGFAIFGLPIAICGWLYYSIAIIVTDYLAIFPALLGVGMFVGHTVKFIEVIRDERQTRKNVEARDRVGKPS